jgi:hypothetical protein
LSDTIIRPLLASSYFRRLRFQGPNGMAIEFVLVAFFTAFSAFQVVFVVSARANSL